ncbi:hypothetical protein HDU86_006805 [Geranomyces michiganensis]|nr:hypothetical protein HDU86_006805 [Geranomyces michiganensis]
MPILDRLHLRVLTVPVLDMVRAVVTGVHPSQTIRDTLEILRLIRMITTGRDFMVTSPQHSSEIARYSPTHPTMALDAPPHGRNGPPSNFQQHGGGPGPGPAHAFNRHGSGGPSPNGPPHGPGGPAPLATRTPPPPTATFDYHPTHWVTFQAPSDVISSMPPFSRLFLGNLASERTDRTELARIFAPYGNIAEIVLKGSFGFVQFDSPEACQRATSESGRKLAGLSMGENYWKE